MKHILNKESKLTGKQDFKMEKGLKLKPRNMEKYNLPVDGVVFFNQSFIEKLLKKKLSRKIDYYLKYIMALLDDDDVSGASIREALNDLSRYRSIVEYKYQEFLDEKFLEEFYEQMAKLEKELKMRLLYQSFAYYEPVEEKKGKSR